MNDLIADQIEWLLTNSSTSSRLGKQLITLIGFLADDSIPDAISVQVAALSRLIVRQEQFDTLVQSLNSITRNMPVVRTDKAVSETAPPFDIASLVEQIEAARQEVAASDPVNYSELIAWITSRARQLKILKVYNGRR